MLWLRVHSCCPWSLNGWRANIAIGAPWWRRCKVVRGESVRRPWFVVGWWLIAARSLLCFWYAMKASRPADAWKTSYVAGDLGSPWWCNGGHIEESRRWPPWWWGYFSPEGGWALWGNIPIFIRLDDNGWLSGLFLSPNRCAKTLNRVESLP